MSVGEVMAFLVADGFVVDRSLVLDDLAVLAGEPHPHRTGRGLTCMQIGRMPPTRKSMLATGIVRR
jgi:hypothetical protein